MKVTYNKKLQDSRDNGKHFTYGKSYNVLADYRKRDSRQHERDNGLVVLDDFGQVNMLFADEITITDTDTTNVYVFDYKE
jgi:hypothetical protein